MTETRQQQAELAGLAGELALGEEPARFIAALEGLGEDEEEAPRDE